LTPFWLDHLLVVVLVVFFPLRASTFGYRRLAIAPLEHVGALRRSLYVQAIALQWMLAAWVVGLWIAHGRDFSWLGVAPLGTIGMWLGLIGALVLGTILWRMRAASRRDPQTLDAYLRKLQHLERMLPHTQKELHLFYAVSLTAGACEELLYRGFLLWYLQHWMGAAAAIALSSAAFGLGHAYQGWKGVLATGLVGATMAIVYLGCDSLWPPIVIHALTDIHAGALAHAALTRAPSEAAAAQEMARDTIGGRFLL
jgi:membrane protease YdiL (CAAX protease family)